MEVRKIEAGAALPIAGIMASPWIEYDGECDVRFVQQVVGDTGSTESEHVPLRMWNVRSDVRSVIVRLDTGECLPIDGRQEQILEPITGNTAPCAISKSRRYAAPATRVAGSIVTFDFLTRVGTTSLRTNTGAQKSTSQVAQIIHGALTNAKEGLEIAVHSNLAGAPFDRLANLRGFEDFEALPYPSSLTYLRPAEPTRYLDRQEQEIFHRALWRSVKVID